MSNPTAGAANTTTGSGSGSGASSRPMSQTSGAKTPIRPRPQQYSISHPHAFHPYPPPTSLRPPLNPNPNPRTHPIPIQQGFPPYSGRGFGIAYRPPPPPYPALAQFHPLPLHGHHQYAYHARGIVRQQQVAADPDTPLARQHPVPGVGRGTSGAGMLYKADASSSPVQNSNGFWSSSDGSKEDKLVAINGRKVRMVEGASLYALCRSWVRNGQPEDCQPLERDTSKPLPRPLPLAIVEDQDVKEDEDEESVVDLSTEDLLKRHIKRAKNVRARLREERLKRIARYKTRLALLLPPQVEQ